MISYFKIPTKEGLRLDIKIATTDIKKKAVATKLNFSNLKNEITEFKSAKTRTQLFCLKIK